METTSSKSSESKGIASRPVIDITGLITIQKTGNREHVVPFIMRRTYASVPSVFIRWLQYSRAEAPSEKDFLYRAWSRFQTPSEYRTLDIIKDIYRIDVYDAVADRDGPVLAIAKPAWLPGCLWTTLF